MSHWLTESKLKGWRGHNPTPCDAKHMDSTWTYNEYNFQSYFLESLLQSVFIRELNQPLYDSGQETVKMPGLELFFVSLHYTRAGYTINE